VDLKFPSVGRPRRRALECFTLVLKAPFFFFFPFMFSRSNENSLSFAFRIPLCSLEIPELWSATSTTSFQSSGQFTPKGDPGGRRGGGGIAIEKARFLWKLWFAVAFGLGNGFDQRTLRFPNRLKLHRRNADPCAGHLETTVCTRSEAAITSGLLAFAHLDRLRFFSPVICLSSVGRKAKSAAAYVGWALPAHQRLSRSP